MDWTAINEKAADFIKKYRYVLLVLLAGFLLMAFPEKKDVPEPVQSAQIIPVDQSLQQELEALLCQIAGAGKVQLLLTISAGETTIYQTDEDTSTTSDSSNIRRQTVLLSESGLIKQINPPQYKGAVVLCQGGDQAAVRLAIVNAVSNATGLTTDHITVLKMK